jgi:hypothetical protein
MSSPSWTPAEARAILDEQRRSGLTPTQFCRQRGWSADRLRYWLSRNIIEPDGFVEVRPALPATFLEVAVGTNARIRVQPGFDAGLLRAVVGALS